MTGNIHQAAVLVEAADRAIAAGDAAKASDLLSKAADLQASAGVLLRLATVRKLLGDSLAAVGAATAAVQLEPTNFLALLTLASLREFIGADHSAGRTYREALRHAPPDHTLPPAVRRQLDWARRRVAVEDEWIKRLDGWSIAA